MPQFDLKTAEKPFQLIKKNPDIRHFQHDRSGNKWLQEIL